MQWIHDVCPMYEGLAKGYRFVASPTMMVDIEIANEWGEDGSRQWYWSIMSGDNSFADGVCKTSRKARSEAMRAWKRILKEAYETLRNREE